MVELGKLILLRDTEIQYVKVKTEAKLCFEEHQKSKLFEKDFHDIDLEEDEMDTNKAKGGSAKQNLDIVDWLWDESGHLRSEEKAAGEN